MKNCPNCGYCLEKSEKKDTSHDSIQPTVQKNEDFNSVRTDDICIRDISREIISERNRHDPYWPDGWGI